MRTLIVIRRILTVFMVLLIASGFTAFPVRAEIEFLSVHRDFFPVFLLHWILQLKTLINVTPDVMLYGTDWLAFAHIVIALFFIPVFIDPFKHKANLIVGMLACIAVFPLAFICGPIRGIPYFHCVIDCAFGVGGFILLYWVYRLTKRLEKIKYNHEDK